ncbi:MAG TPA: GNAT family N-acetyltransferase [Gaiellaceae bacterium]|jgi:ribosomal protein S18 acetylase RimI-like enzyme|nr:GNAT family N-acetyltransferase [Gaiellaceae bacterium]
MTVLLRPIRDDEFADWLTRMRDGYADDMVRNGGFSAERGKAKAAADVESLFPGGQPSGEQFVFVVEAAGEPVGHLWVAERDDTIHRSLFVYELHVEERCRGRGYGKAAMLLAEEEARRRGLARIALNVFGGNAVARGLYLSLGYEEDAVAMSKRL